MLLFMTRKLNYGEPKPTEMTLTLADHSIAYPYEVLKDILVRVDGLLFPANFIILDMPEDSETPLLFGRPFLENGKAFIDVELGELTLWFNKEKLVINVFEAMNNQKENPQCYQINIMKEISKGHHGKKLVRKEFQVLQKVLLYKSCLKWLIGKWKSRWSGPFIVNKVFANGAIEV